MNARVEVYKAGIYVKTYYLNSASRARDVATTLNKYGHKALVIY